VARFLSKNHTGYYKVFNFCIEPKFGYATSTFDAYGCTGGVGCYAFKDHNTPQMELILKFTADAAEWLGRDAKNVVAMHCKAGKGRAGLMCVCLLLFWGDYKTYTEAVSHYNQARTKDKKGLTLPSQQRYAQCYAELCQAGMGSPQAIPALQRRLIPTELRMSQLPLKAKQMMLKVFMNLKEVCVSAMTDMATIRSQCNDDGSFNLLLLAQTGHSASSPPVLLKSTDGEKNNLDLNGDVLVQVWDSLKAKKPLLYYSFHTYFVSSDRLLLDKLQVERAHKDKKHKKFTADFKMEHVFVTPQEDSKAV